MELDKYNGAPISTSAKEESRWRRFLNFVVPWLKDTSELGDAFVNAKVKKAEAEAMSTYADAILKLAKAKNITAKTAMLEAKKAKKIDFPNISEIVIQDKIEEIENKIKVLSVVKGVKIDVTTKNEEKNSGN